MRSVLGHGDRALLVEVTMDAEKLEPADKHRLEEQIRDRLKANNYITNQNTWSVDLICTSIVNDLPLDIIKSSGIIAYIDFVLKTLLEQKFLEKSPSRKKTNPMTAAFKAALASFGVGDDAQTAAVAAADYDKRAKEVRELTHDLREEIATRLQPVLNARIQEMERETLDQKKILCEFVNNELEPLGLAVRCPNTDGLPGKLKATTGNWPGIGYFYFEVYIDGQRKQPAFSDTLPVLELMDAYPPKERGTHFQDKVGPRSSRRGRNVAD